MDQCKNDCSLSLADGCRRTVVLGLSAVRTVQPSEPGCEGRTSLERLAQVKEICVRVAMPCKAPTHAPHQWPARMTSRVCQMPVSVLLRRFPNVNLRGEKCSCHAPVQAVGCKASRFDPLDGTAPATSMRCTMLAPEAAFYQDESNTLVSSLQPPQSDGCTT
jgi:hypothetical protein